MYGRCGRGRVRSRRCGSRRRRGTRARWTSRSSGCPGEAAGWWSCWGIRGCCGFGTTSGRRCRCWYVGWSRRSGTSGGSAGTAVRPDEGGGDRGRSGARRVAGDEPGVPELQPASPLAPTIPSLVRLMPDARTCVPPCRTADPTAAEPAGSTSRTAASRARRISTDPFPRPAGSGASPSRIRYTYCANHPYGRPERDPIQIGPILRPGAVTRCHPDFAAAAYASPRNQLA